MPRSRTLEGRGFASPTLLALLLLTSAACRTPIKTVDTGCQPLEEIPYDGVDQDCDGQDLTDVDGDGFDAPEAGGQDCDDNDAAVHPEAVEACTGVDDDCDGLIDDEDDSVTGQPNWYLDEDGDAFGVAEDVVQACTQPPGRSTEAGDCDDASPEIHPGAQEHCTGLDDDCDGLIDDEDDSVAERPTWYADQDGDGWGDPDDTVERCEQPEGRVSRSGDCDDSDSSINPAVEERCDGIDNDCDDETDEDDAVDVSTWYLDADADGFGDLKSSDVDCDQPSGWVADSSDCDDDDAGVNPAAVEICSGLDDDCDGLVDDRDDGVSDQLPWYADNDSDGYGDATSSTWSCYQPPGLVGDDADCDDSDPSVNPGASETCTGVDDDCDGLIDDEDDSVTGRPSWYEDRDLDGWGDPGSPRARCIQPSGFVADDSDCDDNAAAVNPAADERCDSIDNDCDGLVDDDDTLVADPETWYLDSDGDGYGEPSSTLERCNQPSGWSGVDTDCDDGDPSIHPGATEDTSDGADQDCDGLVDEYLVCTDGSGDYTLIQDAIDDVADGSVIEICPGTYSERLSLSSRTLEITGGGELPEDVLLTPPTGGAGVSVSGGDIGLSNMTLEAAPNEKAVLSTESAYIHLDLLDFCGSGYVGSHLLFYSDEIGSNFTVRRSRMCDASSLTLKGNAEFSGCVFDSVGFYFVPDFNWTTGAGPTWKVSNSIFVGDSLLWFDASNSSGSAEIINNTATEFFGILVTAGDTYSDIAPTVSIFNNIFADIATPDPLWSVHWLDYDDGSGGHPDYWGFNILWDIAGSYGSLCEWDDTAWGYVCDSSVLSSYLASRSIESDPVFVATTHQGSYTLDVSSPAIDSGIGDPDPDGSPNDIGAFGGPDGDWYEEVPWLP